MTILYDDLPVVYGTGEVLKDSKTNWVDFKLKSIAVSKCFDETDKYWLGRSQRMLDCGSVLTFAVAANGDKRLMHARFCRDRMCPACQKRRSLMMFHQVKDVCQAQQKEMPGTRYLLLTLTVPNVEAENLKDKLKQMSKGFYRMFQRAEVKRAVRGWFRALEVTCNLERGDYHPHYHVLLAVSSKYFKGKNYIKQARWLELWQESMRDFSITQIDVRTVKPNPKRQGSNDIESAAAEVGKYATKPKDYLVKTPSGEYLAHSPVVKVLAQSLRNVRLVGFGGSLKEHFAKLGLGDVESDQADLVHVSGNDELIDGVMTQIYRWNAGLRLYMN